MRELLLTISTVPLTIFDRLGQPLSVLARWGKRGAALIRGLPHRISAWCKPLTAQIHPLTTAKALPWLKYKGVMARVKIFVPLALTALITLACWPEAPSVSHNYVLLDGSEARSISGAADFDYVNEALTITQDNSTENAHLALTAGQEVQINYRNQTTTVTTQRETVEHLLQRLHMDVNEREMIILDFSGEVPTISIMYKYIHTRNEVVPTGFETERRPNPLLAKGTEQVVQAGVPGDIVETYDDTYRQGQLVSTSLVGTTQDTAITEIVEYGTMVDEVSRDDRIESVHYNNDGTGYLQFYSGDTMAFNQQVTCEATAYSIGNWTASGRPTKVGNISVDPSVFPYGTRFYIYTNDGALVYGNAVAADCGSGIKGHELDLWFESFDEACWFGRRDCTVFVLS